MLGGTLTLASNQALRDGSSLTVGAGGVLIFDPSVAAAASSGAGILPLSRVAAAASIPSAAAPASVVPEPGTLALLMAGLGLGFGIYIIRGVNCGFAKSDCAITRYLAPQVAEFARFRYK